MRINKIIILLIAFFLVSINVYANGIWYVNTSGQSVAVGTFSCPVLSKIQPYNNLTLAENVRGPFVPLTESCFTSNGYTQCETPLSGMANTLSLLNGRTQVVATTHHGIPAYGIKQLKKGTIPYFNSLSAISTSVSNALETDRTIEVLGTTWTQGETDYKWCASDYETELVRLQADYQADINAITGETSTKPIILSQIGKWYPGFSGVPLAQFRASVGHPGKIICATALYPLDHSAPGAHLTSAGSRRLGEYYGKVIHEMRLNGGFWNPLSPKAITISDNIITLVCHVPKPPIVIDRSLGELEGEGFTFTDGSDAPPSISAVDIKAPDTVRITLSSAPRGLFPRLQYAIAGYVDGRYSWGNIRDSDKTVGSAGDAPLANWMIIFDEMVHYEKKNNVVLELLNISGNNTTVDVLSLGNAQWAWLLRKRSWSGRLKQITEYIDFHFLKRLIRLL